MPVTRSLRARLFLLYALIVILALAGVTALETRAQRGWLLRHNADLLERVARHVARFLPDDSAALAGDWDTALAARDSVTGCRITLIAADGRVLADSRAPAATLENHGAREEVRAALAGRIGTAVRHSHSTGVDFQYVAIPAGRPAPYAVVRVAEPVALLHELDASLLRLTITAALIMLLLLFALLWWVADRQTARIRDLERIAGRIGGGDTSARALERPDDELGRLGGALNRMAADLRERLAALEVQRDERERVLAHMSDGVALLDGQGRIVHVNHSLATILDAPRPAEPGTPFQEFARAPEIDDLLHNARREGRTIELDVRRWGPHARVIRATATPIGEPGREGVLLVLHDLTEAEALSRMRQEFVANVSHELRTPLTSLRGYAETLLEGGLDDVENREGFVRVIRDQAARLQELVDDVLSLAELERGGTLLRRATFDLREPAERQLMAFRERARRGGLTLVLEPGAPVELEADRARIEQVLANLLDNALKYTEKGGVTVTVGGDAARAWCEVRDTGPGIPLADQPRIFERFYRVDKARSRDKGGTGLGLSIVKHIVALHDGEVSVKSAPGDGTTFRFVLPRR